VKFNAEYVIRHDWWRESSPPMKIAAAAGNHKP